VGAGAAVPGSALALLLVAQGAAVLPHAARLSPLLLLVWLLCVLWRLQVFRGRWHFPPTVVKAGLVLLAGVGVALAYRRPFALEPAVALLVVAFALKLLETRSRRDGFVLVLQGYFVVAAELLFEQGMATAARQLCTVALLTAALVALHDGGRARAATESLRTAAVLLLQAIPLTVVMFLFFPRIAPLWSVPLAEGAGRTGIAETMAPGDIARLGRSDELAFRVEFEGAVPPPRELYWRVLTYSRYEDGVWSPGGGVPGDVRLVQWGGRVPERWSAVPEDAPALRYAVVAEPTRRPWLYALDLALPRTPGTGLGRDFRLLSREPVTARLRYAVESRPGAVLDPELPAWLRIRETRLPSTGEPRSRAFLAALVAEHGRGEALVAALLAHFREAPFRYTLTPPTLTGDRIDGFLFDTRAGFCAHYAGAFVYLLRLAGVPARVVAGYQGGELNPVGDHLVVRQYDAHAWAEVWFEGRGWVRVDPTAAVAPGRIESGAEAALAQGAGEAASPFRGAFWRSLGWAMDALYFLDSLEHRWNVLVLAYDADRQSRVLRDLLGALTPLRVALGAAVAGGLALALPALFFLLRRGPRRSPALRLLDALDAGLARSGLGRRTGEPPARWGERVARARPELAADLRALTGWVDAVLFGPSPAPEAPVPPALRRRLLRLRLRLATPFAVAGPAAEGREAPGRAG
jgi:transglutaminase-like putative cysteine protease